MISSLILICGRDVVWWKAKWKMAACLFVCNVYTTSLWKKRLVWSSVISSRIMTTSIQPPPHRGTRIRAGGPRPKYSKGTHEPKWSNLRLTWYIKLFLRMSMKRCDRVWDLECWNESVMVDRKKTDVLFFAQTREAERSWDGGLNLMFKMWEICQDSCGKLYIARSLPWGRGIFRFFWLSLIRDLSFLCRLWGSVWTLWRCGGGRGANWMSLLFVFSYQLLEFILPPWLTPFWRKTGPWPVVPWNRKAPLGSCVSWVVFFFIKKIVSGSFALFNILNPRADHCSSGFIS